MAIHKKTSLTAASLLLTLGLAGCAGMGGGTVTSGNAATATTGAAGGASSVGAASNLERCDQPLGTLAMDDGRDKEWWGSFGATTKVTSIEPLLRLAVQQSNCFVITAIGNSRTEGRLSAITNKQRNSGEFRAGSRQQKGQRVAADYFMEPSIIVDNDATGRMAAGIGGLFGSVGALVGGAMESKVSVVTLSLFDIRSGVQISAAEGSATATNFGAAMGAFGSGAGGALGGFSRTPEGKATVAAFMDAYNKMVVALRNYKAQEVQGGLGRGGRLQVGQ